MKTLVEELHQSMGKHGLYPTFKEWKLAIIHFSFTTHSTSLYPTFKEWKQMIDKMKEVIRNEVYILPLRNENLLAFHF